MCCQQRSVEVLHHAEWVGGEGPGEKQCRGRCKVGENKEFSLFPYRTVSSELADGTQKQNLEVVVGNGEKPSLDARF